MDDRNDDGPSDSAEKIIVDGLFGVAYEENNDENNSVDSDCSDKIQMEVEFDTKVDHGILLDSDNSSALKIPKSYAVISENQEQSRTQNDPILPGCTDEIHMKSVADLIIESQKLFKGNYQNNSKLSDDKECIVLKDKSIFDEKNDNCSKEKIDFGSHALCSNSTNSDKSDIPPSFALISENYEKKRNDDFSKETIISAENKSNCSQESISNTDSVVVLPKGNLPSTLSMISANYQDSNSEDSDSSDVSVIFEVDDDDDEYSVVLKEETVKTRGELDISDLPPIEDLKISVEEDKCQPVGCIKSIIKTLVIVEAFLNQPALDIDSVLFVDRGKRALGRIFDVFGPVNKPYYAVRFNDSEHIKKFDVQIKEPVYCAPQTEYASFVLVSQLLEMKGSDASWRHNNEPPCEHLDYSDDEAEKLAKKKRKQQKCKDFDDNESNENKKSPNSSVKSISKKSSKFSANTSTNSSSQRSNAYSPRPPNVYSPRPQSMYCPRSQNMYSPLPPNYNYGPRPFPTYAQQLSSMDYSHTYRQPYSPYYYDQIYPPRQSYPQYPHPYRPPGPNYQSQQPMDPNNPNQYPHHPSYNYM